MMVLPPLARQQEHIYTFLTAIIFSSGFCALTCLGLEGRGTGLQGSCRLFGAALPRLETRASLGKERSSADCIVTGVLLGMRSLSLLSYSSGAVIRHPWLIFCYCLEAPCGAGVKYRRPCAVGFDQRFHVNHGLEFFCC